MTFSDRRSAFARRWNPRETAGLVCAAGFAALFATPILYAVYVSLLDQGDLMRPSAEFWPPRWDNYARVWTQHPFPRYFLNSIIVCSAITAGAMVTAIMAAYVFARLTVRGGGLLFALVLATLMVPTHVTLIPNYLTIAGLGLRNTYAALILPFLASGFATFFLRQHFKSVPREVEDAARLDGAGHWRLLWTVIVPMSWPAIAAIAVFVFLAEWNSYIWPLIITDTDDMRTVEIGLARLFAEEQEGGINDWPLIIAGAVLILIPPSIIFLFAERHLVRGVAMGSVQ
ncbi:MAG: carbohydrate ABC transporter permease [Inquilinaceae bacterium]